jgi:hypothetical protein
MQKCLFSNGAAICCQWGFVVFVGVMGLLGHLFYEDNFCEYDCGKVNMVG